MNKRKLLAMVTAFVMLLSLTGIAAQAEASFSYPMEYDKTLTYYIALNSNVASSEATLNETPFAKYLEEATGIKVEYIHPTVGSEPEGFNIMLAGGDLTDIIEMNWSASNMYPAGLDAAITNNLVLPLEDYADQMPNYMATLNSNMDWKRMSSTDAGHIPGFTFIRGDVYVQVYGGMIVRQDWLDKLNMEMPTTIDEWTTMLTAFRDELGASAPLAASGGIPNILEQGAFCGAYGVTNGFFVDNGTVKYGRAEEGWKQTLELMAQWYKDGLLNPDFITDQTNEMNAHVLNGDSGAFYGLSGSGIGTFTNSARTAGDEEFNVSGAPYPVLTKGDTPEFGQYDNATPGLICTINPKSENIEAAIRLLDYGYSEEGKNLFNFGKEGESFTMVDGYPTLADSVVNPAEGLSMGNAVARVARSSYGGPFVLTKEYQEQYFQLDNQRQAVTTWGQTNAAAHAMPPVTISEAESEEFNKIITEVDAFVGEYVSLAINGTNDMNNYEAEYLDVLKDIGIERALEIQQAAYDRYMQR